MPYYFILTYTWHCKNKRWLYPNPVTDLLQVEIPANVKPGQFIIADMAGHIIKQAVIPPRQNKLLINKASFARGS